jgi:hypothetical protein
VAARSEDNILRALNKIRSQARLKKLPSCSIATLVRENGLFRRGKVVTWLRNTTEQSTGILLAGNSSQQVIPLLETPSDQFWV